MNTFLKKQLVMAALGVLVVFALHAQDNTVPAEAAIPGDQFNLEGALEFFKNAATLEDFEKALNQPENEVNNLDLNDDGETDYIRIDDRVAGDAHAIVLQAVLSEKDFQDIAVIEIEKTGEEVAQLQIIGDEDLYGANVFIEPFEEEVKTNKNGRGGPSLYEARTYRIVVNVWFWPSVRFIYGPVYRPYFSPWRWRWYPVWYRPFRPRPYPVFYGCHRPWRVHYHAVHQHRTHYAHQAYHPHRHSAPMVRERHPVHRDHNRDNGYRKPNDDRSVRPDGRNQRTPEYRNNDDRAPRDGSADRQRRTDSSRTQQKAAKSDRNNREYNVPQNRKSDATPRRNNDRMDRADRSAPSRNAPEKVKSNRVKGNESNRKMSEQNRSRKSDNAPRKAEGRSGHRQ